MAKIMSNSDISAPTRFPTLRSTASVSPSRARPFLSALRFSTPGRATTAGYAPLSVRVAPQSDVNAMQIFNGGKIEMGGRRESEREREKRGKVKERERKREGPHSDAGTLSAVHCPATECTGWRDKLVRRGGKEGAN